jgi:hypothetical protein
MTAIVQTRLLRSLLLLKHANELELYDASSNEVDAAYRAATFCTLIENNQKARFSVHATSFKIMYGQHLFNKMPTGTENGLFKAK